MSFLLKYTIAIKNARTAQNLFVDRLNHDSVTLRRADFTDKLQQWIPFKTDNGYAFKNVGSGGYLCPDDSITNADGVCVNATKQFIWLLQPVKKDGSNVTLWTIRPSTTSISDNLQNITMEGELKPVKLRTRISSETTTSLWDILSVC
ncbi:hypothetical protein SUGI_0690680 [Cryptomeria japonica]|nr:hypothetical protein SUGI_0690680 [Cryptomeria japonica]